MARSTLADGLAARPAAVFADVLAKLIGTLMASLLREGGNCVRLIDGGRTYKAAILHQRAEIERNIGQRCEQ